MSCIGDEALNERTKLTKTDRLYLQDLGKFTLCFNPLSSGGFLILDENSRLLIDLCDGKKSVKEILDYFPNDKDDILKCVEVLLAKSIIIENTNPRPMSSRQSKSFACWLHLTNSCNLACKYCYVHKSKGEMPPSMAFSIIDTLILTCQINKLKRLVIKYAGGEPLLRKQLLFDLIEHTEISKPNDLSIKQSIITNGTLIDKDIARFVKQHNLGVGLSLDEIDSDNPARVFSDGRGSYKSALRGIEFLREEGVTPTVLVTITNDNYQQLFDLTRFLLSERLNFRFSFEKSYCQGPPDLLENLEELKQVLVSCYKLIGQELLDGNILNVHNFNDIDFRFPKNQVCGAGKNFLAINYDGSIGVCGMGLTTPFSEYKENIDLLNLLNTHNVIPTTPRSEIDECNTCPWIYSCAGGCPLLRFASSGTYDSKSPYCEVFKVVIPEILRIKGNQMIYKNTGNKYT